jgi:hypothetical protein
MAIDVLRDLVEREGGGPLIIGADPVNLRAPLATAGLFF